MTGAAQTMNVPSGTEAVRAFVPTKDFAISKAFYEALGFAKLLDGDVAIFGIGTSAFILQRRYEKAWAENCMMQMMVDDLDMWWAHIQSLKSFHRIRRPGAQASRDATMGLACRLSLRPGRRPLACRPAP